MTRFHYIHIPKTGGSAVRAALMRAPDPSRFVMHEHPVRLSDIPAGEKVFFNLREPNARFVSGFNSRMRQGRPLYDVPWTPIEEMAFARFRTPSALAEALSATETDDRRLATSFLQDVRLLAPLSYWLISSEYVTSRRDDIVAILNQSDLTEDFERLKPTLGLPASLLLPDDPVSQHRNPPHFSTELTDTAIRNLKDWYAHDYDLHAAMLRMRTTVQQDADAGRRRRA